MIIIAYVLTGISVILALAVGLLGGFLGYQFATSYSTNGKLIGLAVILVCLLYSANPVISIWMIKTERLFLSYGCTCLFIILSLGLCIFLGSAIEVSARP